MIRNAGADAVLKEPVEGKPAFVKVQRQDEPLALAVEALRKVIATKGSAIGILIATKDDLLPVHAGNIRILLSPAMQLESLRRSVSQEANVLKKRA